MPRVSSMHGLGQVWETIDGAQYRQETADRLTQLLAQVGFPADSPAAIEMSLIWWWRSKLRAGYPSGFVPRVLLRGDFVYVEEGLGLDAIRNRESGVVRLLELDAITAVRAAAAPAPATSPTPSHTQASMIGSLPLLLGIGTVVGIGYLIFRKRRRG